jgi:hypothetical protein
MFEGWHDFYLVLGPSAAALIGLLFIVVTLTAGLERQRAIRGAQIFMTPIVFHLGVLVLLCTLGLFPGMAALPMGAVTTACGLAGLAYAAYVSHAFLSKTVESYAGDLWYYGIAVGVLYAVMTTAGGLLLARQAFAPYILAAGQIALFLLMVNNAWDLVVFITPRRDNLLPPAGDESV